VVLVADPAFLMDPLEPPAERIGIKVAPGSIGINLSPLMANFVPTKDYHEWVERCAQIVRAVAVSIRRNILLIPHVSGHDVANDGYGFLSEIAHQVQKKVPVEVNCLRKQLSAPEKKWLISQLAAFGGSRTHSTIAALSSCVPTLSFSYSIKSVGINEDIFGSQKWCLGPNELDPEHIAEKFTALMDEADEIKKYLSRRIPEIQKRALSAGKYVREILEENIGYSLGYGRPE